MRPRASIAPLLLVLGAALTLPALGRGGGWELSGFGKVTGASDAEGALEVDPFSGQVQAGVGWSRSPAFRVFAHLIARSDDGESKGGHVGVAEAYLEGNLFPRRDRLRFRLGALFLPTSFENVDALWENPYTISSSALNTWLGEELRPIGLDVTYFRGGWMAGATLYRGNDTLGALPPVRGWTLGDRWTLLGQRVPVNEAFFTSVSAETDGRLGWAARGGWRGGPFAAQYTYLDNRSDGLRHGELFNWNTRFHIVGTQYARGDWTLAAEAGWGPTWLMIRGRRSTSHISAAYLLASRRLPSGRVSARVDSFDDGDERDETLTLGYFWTPSGKLGIGGEVLLGGPDDRALLQLRHAF